MATLDDEELYAHSDHGDDGGQPIDEDLALSPADGYFGANSSPSHGSNTFQSSNPQGRPRPMSSNVPIVPNVMVEDPTLRQDAAAEAKAREAAEEASSARQNPDEAAVSENTETLESSAPQHLTDISAVPSSPGPLSANTRLAASEDQLQLGNPGSAQTTPMQSPVQQHSLPRSPFTHPNHYNMYPDAPPAYSPGPSSSYGAIGATSYDRLPQSMGTDVYNEQQPLLSAPRRSMTAPFPEPNMSTPQWRRFNWTAGTWGFRKRAVCLVAVFLTLFIVAVVVVGYLISPQHQKHDYVEEPVGPPRSTEGEMHWQPLPSCRKSSSNRVRVGQTYHFSPDRNLALLQMADDESMRAGRAVRTFGDVILRPAQSPYFPAGSFSIETISNDESLDFSAMLDPESDTLKVKTPKYIPWQDSQDPCVQLRITLFVPPNALLRDLDIQTQDLGIKFEKGLILKVTRSAQFLTFDGDIISPEGHVNQAMAPYRLDCPLLVVQSINGLIRGWFPLYDDLIFNARYNNIVATIGHKLLKSGKSRPARLTAETVAGNITIKELSQPQSKKSEPRDHRIIFETDSGNINAETLLSSNYLVKSASGNLNLSMTPASQHDCTRWGYPICSLITDSASGKTNIIVNSPFEAAATDWQAAAEVGRLAIPAGFVRYYGAETKISGLQSSHRSDSGDIVAKYPGDWEGTVIASTLSGDLNYTGKGLVMKRWIAINKRMKGKKGEGDSTIVVNSRQGNQRVMIGDGGDEFQK